MVWFLQRKSGIDARILEALDSASFPGLGAIKVTPEQALGVMAVFAAVRVISEDVAKLPAKLKLTTNDSSDIATSEPEHVILNSLGKEASDQDDGFTAMEWIETVVASAALGGLGVAHLNRVGGRTREITPLPRGYWREEQGKWSVSTKKGNWRSVDRKDLMVLRGPQLGLDVTQVARQAIDLARRLDLMMTGLAKKAGRPNGIVSSEGLNSKDKAQAFVDRIKKYFGPNSDGGIMPLDLGKLHYIRLSLTPEELQQDETYARVVTQIASAYRVQPARLMHALTEHNNASLYASNRVHVEDCIQPWTKRFRQAFDKDVLGTELVAQGYHCHIALQGLLQGDPEAQAKYFLAIRSTGAASPLTIAQLADLPTEGISSDPAFPLLTNPNPNQEKDASDES